MEPYWSYVFNLSNFIICLTEIFLSFLSIYAEQPE